MHTQWVRVVVLLWAVLPGGGITPECALATTVRVANLQDLVEQAERIFVGRCVAAEHGWIKTIPYSAYTFQVLDPVKGVSSERVTIKQFGVTQPLPIGNGKALVTRIPGMPRYQPDQAYLLFVVRESAIGLSSPAGLDQGAFLVRGTQEHKKVVNGVDNQNVTRGLSASWLRAKGLTESEVSRLAQFQDGPLDYTFFLQVIKKISQAPWRAGST
jgi:hypothetical protein